MDIKKEGPRSRQGAPARGDVNSVNDRPTNSGEEGRKVHRNSGARKGGRDLAGIPAKIPRGNPTVAHGGRSTFPNTLYRPLGGYLNDPNTVSPLSGVHGIPRQPFRRFRVPARALNYRPSIGRNYRAPRDSVRANVQITRHPVRTCCARYSCISHVLVAGGLRYHPAPFSHCIPRSISPGENYVNAFPSRVSPGERAKRR